MESKTEWNETEKWIEKKRSSNSLKISLIAFLISFGIAGIFQIGQAILKENNMSYRTWMEVTGTIMTIFVVPILFSVMLILAINRCMQMKQQNGRLILIVGNATVLTIILLYVLVMSFVMFLCGESMFEKERMLKDGLLEGTRHVFLGAEDEIDYNYYDPVGWFFKKQNTDNKYLKERMQSERKKKLLSEKSQIKKSAEESDQISTEESDSEEKVSEGETETAEPADNTTPEGAYKTLYDTVFKENGDAYECTYNAKGNFYAILGTGQENVDGKVMNTRRTVVYDRESKNGKCQLFVAYKEYAYEDGTAGNTAILNFYAVDMASGKVFIADKSAWSETGSAEYREATGE